MITGIKAKYAAGLSIHPVIVGLMERRRIVPEARGFESRGIFEKAYPDAPLGPAGQVDASDNTADTPVRILLQDIIHRCSGGGRMTDQAEIEFDPSGSPWTAHGDIAEFHDVVPVDEIPAGRFFNGAPDFASGFRKNEDLDEIIFQLHNFPILITPLT